MDKRLYNIRMYLESKFWLRKYKFRILGNTEMLTSSECVAKAIEITKYIKKPKRTEESINEDNVGE